MREQIRSSSSMGFLLLLLIFIVNQNGGIIKVAEGGKRRVHIPDELDDVIDDEEDEAWKEWGKKSKPSEEFDPPPIDLPGMDPSKIEAEMMKRHFGPSFGFVKLRFGVRRTADTVAEIAMQWTKILKTGSIDTKFMGVDLNTIMFTMEKGQDIAELKEFVLNQPEAYEMKIGNQIHRRPGDPPLEEVIEMLRSEHKVDDQSPKEEPEHLTDEL